MAANRAMVNIKNLFVFIELQTCNDNNILRYRAWHALPILLRENQPRIISAARPLSRAKPTKLAIDYAMTGTRIL